MDANRLHRAFAMLCLSAALCAGPAGAQQAMSHAQATSANVIVPGCGNALAGQFDFAASLCLGIMDALGELGPNTHPSLKLCPLSGVTNGQMIQVALT
jgi:hypothetical protein